MITGRTGGQQHRGTSSASARATRRITDQQDLRLSEHSFVATEFTATIAEIAVASARSSGDGLLSYAVPARAIPFGSGVWVPLRGKPALGVIVRLHGEPPAFAVKPLLAPVDPPTRVSTDQLDTARWLARQSASSLYDALSLFLPPGASHRARPYLRLTDCLRSQPVHAGPAAAAPARRAWRDESRGGAIGAREQPYSSCPRSKRPAPSRRSIASVIACRSRAKSWIRLPRRPMQPH